MEQQRGLVAVYRRPEEARRGMDVLEAAGIEGSRIALAGEQVERTARRGDTSERDGGVVKGVFSRSATWGVIGAVAGGLIGLVLGLAFFGFGGTVASVISGVVAIGGIAAVMGGISKVDMAEDWELSHEGEGKTVVRVETASDEETRAAEKALRGTEVVRILDLTD